MQAEETLRRAKAKLPPGLRRRVGGVKRALFDQVVPAPGPAPIAAPPIATRRAPDGMSRLDVRRSHVLRDAVEGASILEIGPAHNGTLPRRDGFATRNLDYLDRAGLVKKYSTFAQYDPDDIEEVDYVIEAGASFSDTIAERFDLVLASHVLEHSVSLIDFINECSKLLRPEGQLAIVVPDHRFCFDRFRERSSISRVIDTHLSPPQVHTVGTLAEFTLNAVHLRGSGSWPPGHQGRYHLLHGLDQVRAQMEAASGSTYIDVHNWIFSPHHLRLLLSDLADLDLIQVRETHFHPTVGHEFFLNLSPSGSGPEVARERLLRLSDAERRGLDAPAFKRRDSSTS